MKREDFLQNWYAKENGKHGRGLFARKAIQQGDVIDILRGRVVDLNELAYWPDNNSHYCWWQIGKTAWLMAGPPGEFTNHSCVPNAVILDLVKLVALYDIEKDEEIVVDYDAIDWDEHILPMECGCGNEQCRKVIKGYKFLPEETKMKYKQMGIVPEYILELERDLDKELV